MLRIDQNKLVQREFWFAPSNLHVFLSRVCCLKITLSLSVVMLQLLSCASHNLLSFLFTSHQGFSWWWIYELVYLWLLSILLLCTIRHHRLHADLFIFLWLHGCCMACFFPNARNHCFPFCSLLCVPYLLFNQVRMRVPGVHLHSMSLSI